MGCGFSSMSSMIYHSKKKKKKEESLHPFKHICCHLAACTIVGLSCFLFHLFQCASLKLLCLFNVIFSSNHLLSIQS